MRMLSCGVTLAGGLVLFLAAWSAGADDFKPEPGFTLLFNGKDLTGWKLRKGDALDGKTETPDKRFQVQDGKIVIDGKGKGNVFIHTTKEFAKDIHIKFDFLPGPGCNNDIYLRGLKFDIRPGSVTNLKEGEWHELEIVVQGGKPEFRVNGVAQKAAKTKDSAEAASPLMLRAEFGATQFRRIRAKEAP
jgi:hypothetical protein